LTIEFIGTETPKYLIKLELLFLRFTYHYYW